MIFAFFLCLGVLAGQRFNVWGLFILTVATAALMGAAWLIDIAAPITVLAAVLGLQLGYAAGVVMFDRARISLPVRRA